MRSFAAQSQSPVELLTEPDSVHWLFQLTWMFRRTIPARCHTRKFECPYKMLCCLDGVAVSCAESAPELERELHSMTYCHKRTSSQFGVWHQTTVLLLSLPLLGIAKLCGRWSIALCLFSVAHPLLRQRQLRVCNPKHQAVSSCMPFTAQKAIPDTPRWQHLSETP